MNAQKLIASLDFYIEIQEDNELCIKGSKNGIQYSIYPNAGYYTYFDPYTSEYMGGSLS